MSLGKKILTVVVVVFAGIIGLGYIGKYSTSAPIASTLPAPVQVESTSQPIASYPAGSIVTPENMNSPKVTDTPTPVASVKASVQASIKSTPTPKPSVITQTQTTAGGSCQYSCSSPDRDCSDFSTHAQAQAFFNCCGFTADNDPMKLDSVGVGDGVACESLP